MSHVLIVGASGADRIRHVPAFVPAAHTQVILDAAALPFTRAEGVPMPIGPRALILADVHRSFPDAQQGGTRLVLTQSTYLLQKWIDLLDEGDRIVATADRAALERCAPEAFQRRGCWSAFEIVDAGTNTKHTEDTKDHDLKPNQIFVSSVSLVLSNAYEAAEPSERLRLCQEAVDRDLTSAVAWLALASACRENRGGAGARAALDRAAALAPEWEAVAYESGKLRLVFDDLAGARDDFQRAADLMPTFSAAFSNLGATLGELGAPAAALAAFRQALAHDARGFTILNNIGVVCRELGRLDESEGAFLRVIALNPAFVFGHYNLGHTLFLGGRYGDALAAYEEGRRRDPQQNRRQGCRLALARFATGDAEGAERELWRCANAAPPDEREDLLLEAYEVAHALLTTHPALAAQRPFLERLGAEIAKSE